MAAPAIKWPGGKRVRHFKQRLIKHRFASTNCGPCADCMAVQGASGADIRIPFDLQAEWITAMRNQMSHGSGWPATRLIDQRKAFTSQMLTGAYLAAGGKRRPSNGTLKVTHGDVVRQLRQGRWVVVAIDYGRLNDLMPSLSGSTTFRGGHSIVLGGYAKGSNDVAWTYLGDPLHDGGAPGRPRGWQRVRVRRYLRAAETFGIPKAGKGHAYVLWVSQAEEVA